MTENTSNQNSTPTPSGKPNRDNVILIIAIIVAILNFVGAVGALFAFNWLSLILGLLNTIVWVAVILVQLRHTNLLKK